MNAPLAVCTVCGGFTFSPFEVNKSCTEHHGTHHCKGMYEAADRYSFVCCPTCSGMGWQSHEPCSQCRGRRLIAKRLPT
jgi:DnaJ-class molecular chaperone